VVLTGAFVHAQPRSMPTRPETQRPFEVDLLNFQAEPFSSDSLRVDLYLAVPYRSLSFLNAGDKYVADYGVVIQVTDYGSGSSTVGRMIQDKYQTFTVLEPASLHTRYAELSLDKADASQYSFVLAQNHKYDIRVAVRDLGNQKENDTTIDLTTHSIPKSALGISDLMIYRAKRGDRVQPHIGSNIGSLSEQEFGVFAEFYNAPRSTAFGVLARLVAAESDGTVRAGAIEAGRWSSVIVPTGDLRTPIFQPIIPEDLWMGKYALELYILKETADTVLKDGDELRKHAVAYAVRYVVEPIQRGVPIDLTNIDEAIDQVALIATDRQLDSLKLADTPKEKREALLEFWRKRNPDPRSRTNRQMEVFYKRVQYANDNFRGAQHGWRTDRGRLFIALGTPSYVDRHPYEVNQRPYEIWQYYDLNGKYYFVDQYMLGDYQLVSAPPPSGIFMWQRDAMQ
jgi:GWxTD domain-containing protein